LEHVVDRAATLAQGSVIGPGDLPEELSGARELRELGISGSAGHAGLLPMEDLKRRYARHALNVCRGNKAEAARALGIDRKTLISLLEEPS
ncbi:MAG: two-component system response regulator, partial [Armatimonadetes bacterium]|nr:two-component system response regulator [Armatimonadota bacterium]